MCVVVTARPSYSRIRTALAAIRDHASLELQLVVSGSALLDRYGNAIRYMLADGFEIAAQVYMVVEGENLTTMAKSTGIGLMELATVFDNLAPDVVITVADRYETLATAVAGSYMNIPVAHVQGGEVTGSIDEKVRHAVTKLADLHFVSSQSAAERVIRMGEDPASVFVTGCPSIDLAARALEAQNGIDGIFERYGGVGADLDLARGYIVVMQHPVTTEYDRAFGDVTETLHAVRDAGLPTLWFWPNVDAGSDGTSKAIRMFREREQPANIHFFKNMAPEDFIRLLYNSRCLVGNSSVGIRECGYMGVPTVNIGSRQNGRDRATNVIDVGYDRAQIGAAIRRHCANGRYPAARIYGDGRAGERIAELLATVELRYQKQLTY